MDSEIVKSGSVTLRQGGLTLLLLLLALNWLPSFPAARRGLIIPAPGCGGIQLFASSGSGISSPDGLRFAGDRLYIADEGGRAIRVWTPKQGMRVLCDRASGVLSPEDLVVDSDGSVFFTDDDAGGLWRIDASGALLLVAGKDEGLVSTDGIALGPDGRLYVGDGARHRIYAVTKQGEVSVFLDSDAGIRVPESLSFDDEGNLYVADKEARALYLVDGNRRLHTLIRPSQNITPETIAHRGGILYITDSAAGRLYRYHHRNGTSVIASFAGALRNVQGVALDHRGNIYVGVQSDLKNRQGHILKISPGKNLGEDVPEVPAGVDFRAE